MGDFVNIFIYRVKIGFALKPHFDENNQFNPNLIPNMPHAKIIIEHENGLFFRALKLTHAAPRTATYP